ncbi:MAG: hypothetical protein AAGG08_13360, partial [Actinomycetota bacterium]
MASQVASAAVSEVGSEAAGQVQVADIVSLQPARVLETRVGERTADGRSQFGRRLAAGSTTEIPIAGRVGVADDAAAVIVYVTAIRPSGRGFVTLFPCGEQPLASSLNHRASSPGAPVVIGNEVVAKLSAAGTVCVFTNAATDMTFDVVGYVPSTSSYEPIVPVRMLETRPSERTFDGARQVGRTIGAGETIEVAIAGRGDVPASADVAVVYVTAVGPVGPGFVTMFPCGERPLASSLNYRAGDVVGNEVIAKLSDDGTVCAFSSAETHLTFDVVGHVP